MKYLVIGDLHFGMKGFNNDFLSNQLKFFTEQVFPYMIENDIDTIIQLGDWMDNRKSMDIHFFDRIVKEFCDVLQKHNFKYITFLGNHDIYYNSRTDVNLVSYFGKLYPDNIEVIEKREKRMFGRLRFMFMPWIINEPVTVKELQDVDLLFGHFEIKNFEMVKGHTDEKSSLDSAFFKKVKRLKRVVSGHYHVQGNDGFVMYAGTPYQLNWGDYETERGFFVFENTKFEFIENTASAKYVKIKYDDSQELPIEVKGLDIGHADFYASANDIPHDLTQHKVKFFVNVAKDKEYESVIYELHQKGVQMDVINNVEISELIGTDYAHDIQSEAPAELIMKIIKDKAEHLLPLANEIFAEISEE